MAISARRKHLVLRLAAIMANLEKSEESFPLDKIIERSLKKLESRINHESETKSYRKARRDRNAAAAKQEKIEAADKQVAEAGDQADDKAAQAAAASMSAKKSSSTTAGKPGKAGKS